MFTGAHLALFISNSIVPLLWLITLVAQFRRYIRLKEEYQDCKTYSEQVIAHLEYCRDNSNRPKILRQELINKHIHITKTCEFELKLAKNNLIFWTCLAFIFVMVSIINITDMSIKLYHHNCPCELRDANKVEVQVENAKDGPQFSVTTNNLKAE